MYLEFDIELPRKDFLMKVKCSIKNEITGIYGPSGSGKTSLFNIICGLEKKATGFVRFNGRVLFDSKRKKCLSPEKRKVGVVFQDNLLFPHMSIRKNLLFGSKKNHKKKVTLDEIVELLDIEDILDSKPHEISGGEQQRTAIGRAILSNPEILLLDEPFNAVDYKLRSNILPYLKRIREWLEIPILVISHDFPDLQRLTDSVLLLNRGRVVGFNTPVNLLKSRETEQILHHTEPVNVIPLNPGKKLEENLFECYSNHEKKFKIHLPFMDENPFVVTIRPDEIVISKTEVENISIHNQIKGKITDIVSMPLYNYCVVDCGLNLISVLTSESINRLQLKKGDEVYCLFKAYSIKR